MSQNIHIIAFGKAAVPMILAAENELGSVISTSIASIPYDATIPKVANLKTIFINGAKNNLPDKGALEAGLRIENSIKNIPETDIVLILISGGGSALLTSPIPGITIEEKHDITKMVAATGANIRQINIIRQALSTLKGGQLAEKLYPRKVISLILSDVVGDPIQYIASGPTYIDESVDGNRRIKRYEEALNIFKKLNIFSGIPFHVLEAMKKYAYEKNNLESKTTSKDGRVRNIIIGNNMKGLQILRNKLISMSEKYYFDGVTILTDSLERDVDNLAKNYGEIVKKFLENEEIDLSPIDGRKNVFQMKKNQRKLAFLIGGEWVIKLNKNDKNGIGGRNQNLVLTTLNYLINHIHESRFIKKRDFKFVSLNTDGFDGPTTAAGAMINGKDLIYFLSQKSNSSNKENSIKSEDLTISDITKYIKNRDSFNFWSQYKNGRNHLITGRTNTNFMDLTILILEKCN
uniref:Glycerate kinase n=1 Tax=Parastrongyloides trichosuri TaxID=131310 RepID=A0A0N5A375_PARTI